MPPIKCLVLVLVAWFWAPIVLVWCLLDVGEGMHMATFLSKFSLVHSIPLSKLFGGIFSQYGPSFVLSLMVGIKGDYNHAYGDKLYSFGPPSIFFPSFLGIFLGKI